MSNRAWIVVVMLAAVAPVVESQQPAPAAGQATALPSPVGREPSWAFPVQAGQLPAELRDFTSGVRKDHARMNAGVDAALMKRPVAQLTDDDIVNLAAYAASLPPR
jgi:cytochrome c553